MASLLLHSATPRHQTEGRRPAYSVSFVSSFPSQFPIPFPHLLRGLFHRHPETAPLIPHDHDVLAGVGEWRGRQIGDGDPVGRVRDAMRRLRNELERPDFPGFPAKMGNLPRESKHM